MHLERSRTRRVKIVDLQKRSTDPATAGDQIQIVVKVDAKEYKVFLWRTGQVRWMHEIVRSRLV
jgi:hypothetical protein